MRIEPVFVFDLDGTLVDSVYHHVFAWREALEAEGISLSFWRIHRKVGMSGGLLANQLLRETGVEISAAVVERLKQRHAAAYKARAGTIRPLPGAIELLSWLSDRKIPWAKQRAGTGRLRSLLLLLLGSIPTRRLSSSAIRSNMPSPIQTCS
jgi:phosphoglycolate phosphatase-like HAD superfamily hydrolase